MATVPEQQELPFIDTDDPAFLRDPYDSLRKGRERNWLARSPRGLEVLTHDAVQAMFRDRRFHEGGPQIAAACGLDGDAYALRIGDMMFKEGESHRRLRLLVSRFFTPRALEMIRAQSRELFDRQLARLEKSGGGDFVSEVAIPVPSRLFCEVLGVPATDAGFLAEATSASLDTFRLDPNFASQIAEALGALAVYLRTIIESKRGSDGGDFMGALAVAHAAGEFTMDEVVNLAISIVEGSSDNTSHTLSLSVLTLREHPEQWSQLVANPDLAAGAAEECMRYQPRVRSQVKICDAPTEFNGFEFPANEWIFQSIDAANRDPEVFTGPDRFRIARIEAARHLGFGSGHHVCLGAPLARIELTEGIRTIATRWQDFSVADHVPIQTATVRGVERMEVAPHPRVTHA